MKQRDGDCKRYLATIGRMPSCISRRVPCIPHHLRKRDERGVGLKARDRWALPLTNDEHLGAPDCVHTVQTEEEEIAWFRNRGVDPYPLAETLWKLFCDGAGDDALRLAIARHHYTPTPGDY